MQSKATTVEAYLAELPEDRRAAIAAVRKVILKNLDKNYAEAMQYGMIGYAVPHTVFPPGYHCDPKQPLPFAALASQKNYMSLYLMGLYCGCGEPGTTDAAGHSTTPDAKWFHDAWAKTGKKLDMGKSCIRFKKLDDLPLDVIGEAIKRVPAALYIDRYLQVMEELGKPVKAAGIKPAPPSKPAPASTPAALSKPARPAKAKKATRKD